MTPEAGISVRELDSIAIVGAGRLGTALAAALRAAGYAVLGPLGRGADARGATAVLLCVPDGEIAAAAAAVDGRAARRPLLRRHRARRARAARGVLAAPADDRARRRAARTCSPAPAARSTARRRARSRRPRRSPPRSACAPRTSTDEDRAAYHAAASIASNFLVTLEGAAERLAATAGVDRALLAPLVRAAVENWAARGAEQALTGPIARGDEETVARQRAAVAERTPDLLPLFDALVDATRAVVV